MFPVIYMAHRVPRTHQIMIAAGSGDEIAEHLSIPMGTVKSRIFHARKKLQEDLVDYRR